MLFFSHLRKFKFTKCLNKTKNSGKKHIETSPHCDKMWRWPLKICCLQRFEAADLFISQWVRTSVFLLRLPDFLPSSAPLHPNPSLQRKHWAFYFLVKFYLITTDSPCICRMSAGLHNTSTDQESDCSGSLSLSFSLSVFWLHWKTPLFLRPSFFACPLVILAVLNKEKTERQRGKKQSVCLRQPNLLFLPQLPVLTVNQEDTKYVGQTSPNDTLSFFFFLVSDLFTHECSLVAMFRRLHSSIAGSFFFESLDLLIMPIF